MGWRRDLKKKNSTIVVVIFRSCAVNSKIIIRHSRTENTKTIQLNNTELVRADVNECIIHLFVRFNRLHRS